MLGRRAEPGGDQQGAEFVPASRGLSDDKATTVKSPCLLRHVTVRDSAEPKAVRWETFRIAGYALSAGGEFSWTVAQQRPVPGAALRATS